MLWLSCLCVSAADPRVDAFESVLRISTTNWTMTRHKGNTSAFVYGALLYDRTLQERGMTLYSSELATLRHYKLVVSRGYFSVVPSENSSVNGYLKVISDFLPEPTYTLRTLPVRTLDERTRYAVVHTSLTDAPSKPFDITLRYWKIVNSSADTVRQRDHLAEQLAAPIRVGTYEAAKVPKFLYAWQKTSLRDMGNPLRIGINGKLYECECDASEPALRELRSYVVRNGYMLDMTFLFSRWTSESAQAGKPTPVSEVVHNFEASERRIRSEITYALQCWNLKRPVAYYDYEDVMNVDISVGLP
jgi:hypothetical protein